MEPEVARRRQNHSAWRISDHVSGWRPLQYSRGSHRQPSGPCIQRHCNADGRRRPISGSDQTFPARRGSATRTGRRRPDDAYSGDGSQPDHLIFRSELHVTICSECDAVRNAQSQSAHDLGRPLCRNLGQKAVLQRQPERPEFPLQRVGLRVQQHPCPAASQPKLDSLLNGVNLCATGCTGTFGVIGSTVAGVPQTAAMQMRSNSTFQGNLALGNYVGSRKLVGHVGLHASRLSVGGCWR